MTIFSNIFGNVNNNNGNKSQDTPVQDTPTFDPDTMKRKAGNNARKWFKGSPNSPLKLADLSETGKGRKADLKKWVDTVTSVNCVGRKLFVFTRNKDTDDDKLLLSLRGTFGWDILRKYTSKEDFKKAWFNFVHTNLHRSLLMDDGKGGFLPVEYVQDKYPVLIGLNQNSEPTYIYYDVYTFTATGEIIPYYVPRVIEKWSVTKAVQLIIDDDERRKKTGKDKDFTNGERFFYTPNGERHIIQDTPVQDTPVQDTPAQDTPAQDTPAQDTPDVIIIDPATGEPTAVNC